jgi:hypothetical protein
MSVSGVIPAYNRARRLPAAIDSVLRQGVADIEIIVVDDGSIDDTRDVVAQYGDRVRYIYQANAGVGAARNTGIRHATKEFVAFLDSDDRWHDCKLGMQLALFRAHPEVGLVFSEFEIEKGDGRMVANGASIWAGRDLDFPEMTQVEVAAGSGPAWPAPAVKCWVGPMYRQLLDELPVLTSSVIVRRSVLDSTTWYTERVVLFEDWEFFARVASRAMVGFVVVPTTVNVGHEDPGRVSKCSNLDRARSYASLLERVWLRDTDFAARYDGPLRSAYGRSLLAIAREALLAGQRDQAREAMERWHRGGFDERRGWAAIYTVCARVMGGRALLRNVMRGRTLSRLLLQIDNKRTYGQVNPAA